MASMVRAPALVLTMLVLLWLPDAVDAVRLKRTKREVRRSTHERNQKQTSSDGNESRGGIVEASPPANRRDVTRESSEAILQQIFDTIHRVLDRGATLDDVTASLVILLGRGADPEAASSSGASPPLPRAPIVLPSVAQAMRSHLRGNDLTFFMASVLVDCLNNNDIQVEHIVRAIQNVADAMEPPDATASSSTALYRGRDVDPIPEDAPPAFWSWLRRTHPGVYAVARDNLSLHVGSRLYALWNYENRVMQSDLGLVLLRAFFAEPHSD